MAKSGLKPGKEQYRPKSRKERLKTTGYHVMPVCHVASITNIPR